MRRRTFLAASSALAATAALSLPTRWYAYRELLKDRVVREKLVHGSDWPIPAFPPPGQVGWVETMEAMRTRDWLQRDIVVKRCLGFDEAYWQRAGHVLRVGDGVNP